jgi:hyaluronoglucosaminidase
VIPAHPSASAVTYTIRPLGSRLQQHIQNQPNPFSRTDRWLRAIRRPDRRPRPAQWESARATTSGSHPGPADPVDASATDQAQTSTLTASTARFLAAAAKARQPTGWVAYYASASGSPVNLTTRTAGPPIPVGPGPQSIVATPDGRTAYVADSLSDTVTPIAASTGQAGRPIRVGADPSALAITPDGKTLHVADDGSDTVTPIAIATNKPGEPIPVGRGPRAIAMAPGGRTAYMLNCLSATVAAATDQPGRPIRVGAFPVAYAFGPGARTLDIASFGADSVTPVDTPPAVRPDRSTSAPTPTRP